LSIERLKRKREGELKSTLAWRKFHAFNTVGLRSPTKFAIMRDRETWRIWYHLFPGRANWSTATRATNYRPIRTGTASAPDRCLCVCKYRLIRLRPWKAAAGALITALLGEACDTARISGCRDDWMVMMYRYSRPISTLIRIDCTSAWPRQVGRRVVSKKAGDVVVLYGATTAAVLMNYCG